MSKTAESIKTDFKADLIRRTDDLIREAEKVKATVEVHDHLPGIIMAKALVMIDGAVSGLCGHRMNLEDAV